MKITKRQLKRIIREEKTRLFQEGYEDDPTMVRISYGDIADAVVPILWIKGHPDDIDGEMMSKNEAIASNYEVFYEGSHANLKHIEDYYYASNTLYSLLDEGYLDTYAPLTSIFH